MAVLKFEGHQMLRHRLVLATLAGKAIRIDNIRADSTDQLGLTGTRRVKMIHSNLA